MSYQLPISFRRARGSASVCRQMPKPTIMKTSTELRPNLPRTGASMPSDKPSPDALPRLDAAGNACRVSTAVNPPRAVGPSDNPLPAEQVLAALRAIKRGDFDVRLTGARTGGSGQGADTFNEVAEMIARSTGELTRISRRV